MTKLIPFIIFLIFSCNSLLAQNKTKNMLGGTWFYYGKSEININDTVFFHRDKLGDSFLKWELKDNGNFYSSDMMEEKADSSSQESLVIVHSYWESNWNYDPKGEKLSIRARNIEYRIINVDDKNLEMVRLK